MKFINIYFNDFIYYIIKGYDYLVSSIFFFNNYYNNLINYYNIFLFCSLNIFYFINNLEDIKFEHEKTFIIKEKWKNIRIFIFKYLNINIFNEIFYISFFTLSIYEYYILPNQYNIHYITFKFFDYWVDYIIEKNYNTYKKKKENFKFKNKSLKNLYINIFKKNFFSIRIYYNLFISNIDYFIFIKDFTYNYYIRNYNYFFEFTSQKKIFLKYNNPASVNKGSLTIWDYDKLYKKYILFLPNNINNDFNLFNIKSEEIFFNFYKKNEFNISNSFFKDFNIKFLYKLKTSNYFFHSINKFFNFNLIDFFNFKNRLESYKDVMAIKSVYEYRFANSSFKVMDEFIVTIFKTPLENFIYFDDLYKNINNNIIINIFKTIGNNFFLKDMYNINNLKNFKNYLQFLKFFSRIFKLRIYFFKFEFLWNLIEEEKKENLLKIDVFSKFYDILEEKKIFYLIQKFRRKKLYKKWGLKNFFNIIKYNTMFYLDIYSIHILYSGWLYEIIFFFRYIYYVQIYNKFVHIFNVFNNYKYLISLKDFFFQLFYENIDYSLIFLFFFIKKIKLYNNYRYINIKNKIINNFIYRKYTYNAWLEYTYYNDLFDDLYFFSKENYSNKLSKWILRYFYKNAELYMFYSESLQNRYINNKRLFI